MFAGTWLLRILDVCSPSNFVQDTTHTTVVLQLMLVPSDSKIVIWGMLGGGAQIPERSDPAGYFLWSAVVRFFQCITAKLSHLSLCRKVLVRNLHPPWSVGRVRSGLKHRWEIDGNRHVGKACRKKVVASRICPKSLIYSTWWLKASYEIQRCSIKMSVSECLACQSTSTVPSYSIRTGGRNRNREPERRERGWRGRVTSKNTYFKGRISKLHPQKRKHIEKWINGPITSNHLFEMLLFGKFNSWDHWRLSLQLYGMKIELTKKTHRIEQISNWEVRLALNWICRTDLNDSNWNALALEIRTYQGFCAKRRAHTKRKSSENLGNQLFEFGVKNVPLFFVWCSSSPTRTIIHGSRRPCPGTCRGDEGQIGPSCASALQIFLFLGGKGWKIRRQTDR